MPADDWGISGQCWISFKTRNVPVRIYEGGVLEIVFLATFIAAAIYIRETIIPTIAFFLAVIFMASLLHEFGHIIMAKLTNMPIVAFAITAGGMRVCIEDKDKDKKQRLLVMLGGIAANITIAILCIALRVFEIFPKEHLESLAFLNLCIGLGQLIPFWGSDGENVLKILREK